MLTVGYVISLVSLSCTIHGSLYTRIRLSILGVINIPLGMSLDADSPVQRPERSLCGNDNLLTTFHTLSLK